MGLARRIRSSSTAILAVLFAAQSLRGDSQRATWSDTATLTRLPTGVHISPLGDAIELGSMPLSMIVAPGGRKVVVSMGGWREQGIQIIDVATRNVTQTIAQGAAFFGLAFSPAGRTLYVSGGNDDAVYCYGWDGSSATLVRKIALTDQPAQKLGTRYPAGLALSADGALLYVAENLAESVAVVDLHSSKVVQRVSTGRYPYAVVVSGTNLFVSAWGADMVSMFRTESDGRLVSTGIVTVGRHPSALLSNENGSRLFVALATTDTVAIVDTQSRRVIRRLRTSAPGTPAEGSTPNALALSADSSKLFVALADSNAIGVFQLSSDSAGLQRGESKDRLLGLMPSDWYPTAVVDHDGDLLVLTGKGRGSGPNPGGPRPDVTLDPHSTDYTLGQTNGTLRIIDLKPALDNLRSSSDRVANANGWLVRRPTHHYPPFRHVIYIIKENRTYDQLFGDMREGDGDANLLFFGRDASPNHHVLAERFGLFDRFFTNAEVSSQGHKWSTAAYVTDYGEKTIPSAYSERRGGEDDEGDVDEPSTGYLWDAARRRGVTFRDYGEWFISPGPAQSRGRLDQYISHDYPPFDMTIPDQRRADVWISELKTFDDRRRMPRLQILHLPADHTAGGRAGLQTPRACMADNDLALGRMVDALSHSRFWHDTVMFVVEDDAQAGPDHVDSHRAPFLLISAYSRRGTNHRFVNTTDVVAAIEDILGLDRLSQYDYFSRPLSDVFAADPDMTPYTAIAPGVPLNERNPALGEAAARSDGLDLSAPDRIDDALFNDILWKMLKGEQARPAMHSRSPIHLLQSECGR